MDFNYLLFTQNTSTLPFLYSPPWFWLTVGITLGLFELIMPKTTANKYKFIALVMGMGALIVAFILWRAQVALEFDWQYVMYEGFDLQVTYWMGVSIALVIWIRPMFIQRKKVTIPDATEAKTMTEFLPGRTGRVLYEGCSWQAYCADDRVAIAANQKVYVLRREGNTLIIAPDLMFHS